MNVLLLSMPDSFEHMPAIVIRMPNGALTSLAANVDPHHRVAVADLILVQRAVRSTIERLVREFSPDVIGLSVMTFQRRTAKKIIRLVRALRPGVQIVIGGYDPTLAPEAYSAEGEEAVDFIVRSEGEGTFRELLRSIESGGQRFDTIAGLSFRSGKVFQHSSTRAVQRLESDDLRLPNRNARVLRGYTMLGRQIDVIETSRGCTFDCSFCSIIEMRGRNFHLFPIERVIEDIQDACRHGARAIFIVDDNITLNVPRFEILCEAIIRARLNHLDFYVQAMTSAIANHGARLAPLMRRAGFRYVFLGIENMDEQNLQFLRATAKNTQRNDGVAAGNASVKAIQFLRQNGMYVVGGLILGSPADTPASVETNLKMARHYVDWPYIQHPTPYPRTPMTKDFQQRGLIVHERLEEYDGTTAVVKTEHMSGEEVEFMRWKAERWMKMRHFPVVLKHDPAFVLRHAPQMLAHTFRGCSWKTLLGLEDERLAFARYRAIRASERNYL
jgi:anaerobic magnesium-protoporphyrin IX monomethyl ester cyclase